jgi:hypothetical protein
VVSAGRLGCIEPGLVASAVSLLDGVGNPKPNLEGSLAFCRHHSESFEWIRKEKLFVGIAQQAGKEFIGFTIRKPRLASDDGLTQKLRLESRGEWLRASVSAWASFGSPAVRLPLA